MKRECLDCGETFDGRIDKKFCSDYCRNNHNNRLNKDANNYCRSINRILRNNRRVLEDMAEGKRYKIPREKLLSAGFNFDYLTNIYKTKTGKTYYFCYDFAYIENDDNTYNIVERKDYVD
jgi:hypothetical protein